MEYYLVYSFISFVSRRCLSKPIPVGFLYLCAVAVLWGPMLVTLVLTKQGLFFSGDDMILIFCCDTIMFICFVMWTTNMLIPYISLPKRFFPFFSITFGFVNLFFLSYVIFHKNGQSPRNDWGGAWRGVGGGACSNF